MPYSKHPRILAASIATLAALTLIPSQAFAIDLVKANNADALNTAGSWVGGIPDGDDVALWNNTLTVPNAAQLGANTAWQGIRVANIGGTRNQSNAGFLTIANTDSAHTLTIGGAGIDVSAAFQTLVIQSKILLSDNQTWSIGNSNNQTNPASFNQGEDLAFTAQAAGAAFDLGGRAVNTTGVGNSVINGGYTISNGTINVGNSLFVIQGGSSRTTTINSDVTINVAAGSIFKIQSNSGALSSAATVNLNGGTFRLQTTNSGTVAVNHTGTVNVITPSTISVANGVDNSMGTAPLNLSGNIVGSAALSIINNVTGANNNFIRFGGDNSGYTGTLTFSGQTGRASRLVSANAGSAAATWVLNAGHTLQVDGVGVQLGTLNGGGTISNSHTTNAATINVGAGSFSGVISNGTAPGIGLTKVGAGSLTLTGANSYTGPTTVTGGTLSTTTAHIGAGSLNVGDATFALSILGLGAQINASTLTTGGTSGGTIVFNNGTLGNPTAAPINVTGAFTTNAPTTLRVIGTNLTAGSAIPLIDYTGASIGGIGFGGLNLVLPARTVGNLVDNTVNQRVDLNISSIEQIKWNGNVSSDWDIDPTGANTQGTPNWLTTVTNTAARYLQGTGGVDTVNFDDTATGTTVNLTATLAPNAVVFNNSSKTYTLTGSGHLSGLMSLTKTGTERVIFATTTAGDYTGGTTVEAGTLQYGDGVTAGAGVLPGGVFNVAGGATLALNRVDDFTFSNALNGTGTFLKAGPNTVNVPGANTYTGPITVTGGVLQYDGAATHGSAIAVKGGTLRYQSGGTLSGVVSGAGTLAINGGTMVLSGDASNTVANTLVTAGTVHLNKSAGFNAIGGDLVINDGTVELLADHQIDDAADVTINGGIFRFGTGAVNSRNETFANFTIAGGQVRTAIGAVTAATLVTVSDTLTVTGGDFNINSGSSLNANKVVFGGGVQNVHVLAGASTVQTNELIVGPGGIEFTGANLRMNLGGTGQLGSRVVLNGDVTSFASTLEAGFFGESVTGTSAGVREINIGSSGTRTFNIADGAAAVDFRSSFPLVGGATLRKIGDGTMVAAVSTFIAPIDVAAGTLRLSAGTVLGPISTSGTGAFEVAGTVQLSGVEPNIMPLTLVSGRLQLNKIPGVNAVGGDITLTGAGELEILADNQIPDTATIRMLGTSTQGMAVGTGVETFANVIVNPSVAAGQFIMRSPSMTVTNLASVLSGIFATASGTTAFVNRIDLSPGAIVRVAGGSAASVLTVGAGGLHASGGTIEVKFSNSDFDATLNLEGDFTATGNVTIGNGAYAGGNLNVINLIGTRLFNIAPGTTTTVAPDFGGVGDFVKTGAGTLQLNASSVAAHTGATTISEGTLRVSGSINGTSGISVTGSGTLAGTGTIQPGPTGSLLLQPGGRLAPGNDGPGLMQMTFTDGGGLNLSAGVAAAASGSLLFDLGAPGSSDQIALTGGPFNIGDGVLEFNDFVFSAITGFDTGATYTLFNSDSSITGFLGLALAGSIAGQPFALQLGDNDTDIILVPVPEPTAAALLLIGLPILSRRVRKARA